MPRRINRFHTDPAPAPKPEYPVPGTAKQKDILKTATAIAEKACPQGVFVKEAQLYAAAKSPCIEFRIQYSHDYAQVISLSYEEFYQDWEMFFRGRLKPPPAPPAPKPLEQPYGSRHNPNPNPYVPGHNNRGFPPPTLQERDDQYLKAYQAGLISREQMLKHLDQGKPKPIVISTPRQSENNFYSQFMVSAKDMQEDKFHSFTANEMRAISEEKQREFYNAYVGVPHKAPPNCQPISA